MIELLIKYITDKGFEVDVLPGMLKIWKEAKGETFGKDWAISKHDLRPDFEECLYYDAARCCVLIDKEIEKYQYAR